MRITISIPDQRLDLRDDASKRIASYAVSTAKNGPGEKNGSYCTPRGHHIIRAKVGAGETANTVFVRRRPTGEIWTPELAAQFPGRDWILTRILWLSGKQPGFNRLGEVDTMRRYVYLHGSPDTVVMGTPGSIGCVRMRNADIVELFDRVPVLTRVDIDDFQVTGGDWISQEAAAMPLREAVFVGEQGVPADMERDEHDSQSWHAVAYDAENHPIGTGRLLPDGHIGRLAVAANWRGHGVGRALLDALIDEACQRDYPDLLLNAQTQVVDFYRRFGFVDSGPVFMEAGIPHQAMRRELIPVFDKAVIKEVTEVAGIFPADLIEIFLTEAYACLFRLRTAQGMQDFQSVERIAHSLKSSAANVGAMRLARFARLMEKSGVEHFDAMIEELAEEVDRFRQAATVS